ncbi:MAG: 5-(carboxyamino)imidazole ribonucleotide mutase [Thermoproteota archaeon]
MPKVAVILGSKSDEELGKKIGEFFEAHNIDYEYKILSAHRNPEKLDQFLKSTNAEVFIAIAGLSAALPGYLASRTIKPVIGLPRSVKLGGIDALLSIVQMPSGVPVATVGIDNWKNAALLALEILALKYPEFSKIVEEEREEKNDQS